MYHCKKKQAMSVELYDTLSEVQGMLQIFLKVHAGISSYIVKSVSFSRKTYLVTFLAFVPHP